MRLRGLALDYLEIWFCGRYLCGDGDEVTIAETVLDGLPDLVVPPAMVPRFREMLLDAINADSDAGESRRMLDAASKVHLSLASRSEDRPRS